MLLLFHLSLVIKANPIFFQDTFAIGKITKTVGNAFACSNDELWKEEEVKSPSGLSVNGRTLSHPFLINRDGEG